MLVLLIVLFITLGWKMKHVNNQCRRLLSLFSFALFCLDFRLLGYQNNPYGRQWSSVSVNVNYKATIEK